MPVDDDHLLVKIALATLLFFGRLIMQVYFRLALLLTGMIIVSSPLFAASICNMPDNYPGISQDYVQDVKCLTLSAKQGDATAQNNLGFMYAEGQGVPQNLIVAYAWWTIANTNGIETARDKMVKAEEKLTPAQADQARNLAKVLYARTCR